MNDSIQTIRRSAKHFFSGTMLSRLTGMLRDISMAYAFGTQPAVASFMLAFRFAHLLRRLFGEGALQSAFIPQFESLRHENPEKAFHFFRDLYVLLTLSLSLLITLGSLGLGTLLMTGSLSEANQEIVSLTALMLPSLLFICLYGFNTSLLQCEKQFFISSVAPSAFNGIWILTVLFLYYFKISGPDAMPLLAVGVILACFCQWLLTAPRVLSILKKNCSSKIWKNIHLYSPDIKRIGKPLFLGIIGIAAFQVNNTIDALFALYAEPEGPAFLWYAIRLQQLPLALFGIAIANAILPPLSRAIKALDWNNYYYFLEYGLKHTIALILPLTFLLLIIGDTSTNLIYGHGNFSDSSIVGTTKCLWAYALGLLPSALVLILAPACYAQSDYRLPTYASFLTMFINLILNTLLIVVFHLGAMSVAIATSISAWVNLFFLTYVLSKRNGSLLSDSLMHHVNKIGFATFLAFFGTFYIRNLFQGFSFKIFFTQTEFFFPKEMLHQSLNFIYQVGSFALLFGLGFFFASTFSAKLRKITTSS
jgi:putative peptidoglycan lipid II flippase